VELKPNFTFLGSMLELHEITEFHNEDKRGNSDNGGCDKEHTACRIPYGERISERSCKATGTTAGAPWWMMKKGRFTKGTHVWMEDNGTRKKSKWRLF
jgi:hypothetical protein